LYRAAVREGELLPNNKPPPGSNDNTVDPDDRSNMPDLLSRLIGGNPAGGVDKATAEALRLAAKAREQAVDQEAMGDSLRHAAEAASELAKLSGVESEVAIHRRQEGGSVTLRVRSPRSPRRSQSAQRRRRVVVFACFLAGCIGTASITAIWVLDNGLAEASRGTAGTHDSSVSEGGIRVVDGDTIVLSANTPDQQEERVRLLSIDTPERGDHGFAEAGEALRELIGRNGVQLVYKTDGKLERDRYGRLLAYVFADGVNVNIEMVRLGWSPYYTEYGRSRFDLEFREAEAEARSSQRGLWRR